MSLSWVSRATTFPGSWNALVWSGGQYLLVPYSPGSNYELSLDAETWASHNASGDTAYPGRSAAVLDSGRVVSFHGSLNYADPADLEAWTQVAFPVGAYASQASDYTATNGTVAFASDSNTASSKMLAWDGTSFTQGNYPSTGDWYAVGGVPGGGNLVALKYGTNQGAYSSDHGATWTAVTLPVSGDWSGVIAGKADGTLIAVAYGSNTGLRSLDGGLSWSTLVLPATANWTAIQYIQDTLVLVATGSGTAWASVDDGDNWEAGSLPSTSTWSVLGTDGFNAVTVSRADPASIDNVAVAVVAVPEEPEEPAGSTIVFAPLVDSPETVGTLVASLPALTWFASDSATNLLLTLPRLQASFAGALTEQADGALVAELPALTVVFVQAEGNLLRMDLPALAFSARDAGALVPQSGDLLVELPPLELSLAGPTNLVGSLGIDLPALQWRALEAAGDSLIMDLPPLGLVAYQLPPIPVVSGLLLQSPGLTWAYAPITQALDIEASLAPVAEAAPARLVANLVAELALSAEALTRARFRQEASAALSLRAIAQVVFRIVSEAVVTVEAASEATRRQLVAAVAVLEATAVASSRLAAIEQLAAVLAVEALATRGARLEAETGAAVSAELLQRQRHLVREIAALVPQAEAERRMRITVLADASVVPVAEALTLAHLVQAVEAGCTVVASLRLFGEDFSAWVINAESEAAWRYSGYDFNSFAGYDQRDFGVKRDGLYLLEGDTDAGVPIDWRLKTGLLDFGSPQLKRLPALWLAWSNTGQAYLKVAVTTPRGRKEVHWYTIGTTTAADIRPEALLPGKGLESLLFQLTLESIDGSRVDVDALRYAPLMTQRRS